MKCKEMNVEERQAMFNCQEASNTIKQGARGNENRDRCKGISNLVASDVVNEG